MQSDSQNVWKKCSSCKKPLASGVRYYVCSVSTCNGQRTGYVFCSVPCFEVHLPSARHKDAAAIEMKAEMSSGTRRIVSESSAAGSTKRADVPQEVLVVASRLKEYIQARAGMNTSAQVMDVLSDHLRILCDRAVENARAEGRKTVMDRDFSFLKH